MRYSTLVAGLLATLIIPMSAGAQRQATAKARVRLIHAVPGLTDSNLRLNRTSVFAKVQYGYCMPYASVTAGEYLLDVTTMMGQTTIIPPADVVLAANYDYTALLSGSISGEPELDAPLIELPKIKVARSQVHLVFVNAAPDVPDADFLVDGNLEAPSVPFRDYDGPIAFPSGKHTIEVIGSGPLLAGPLSARLQGGSTTFVVLMGTLDPNDGYPLTIGCFSSR
jgi:hypothetical protein